jgi:hypothetical protein
MSSLLTWCIDLGKVGSQGRMTDSDTHEAGSDTHETNAHETEAELRISRIQALNGSDLVSVVTYLLAKHPDTFPPMLDDALSSVSPKNN